MATVRLLTAEDAAQYVTLRREMLLDSPWAFGRSPGEDPRSQVDGVLATLAEADSLIVGALEEARDLVGVAGIKRETPLKRRHIGYVWGVYVSPRARGCGLGRALMERVIAEARGFAGVEKLQLGVSQNSPAAKGLYESVGFVEWGREPDCIRVNGRSYTEVHMWRAMP